MDDTTLLIALTLWVVCGIGAYLITAQKGRDDAGSAGIMGFVLGPIGLVIAAAAKAPTGPRTCKNCGATVAQDRTVLCQSCGQRFA